jgi:hypothetical protein
MDGRPPDDVPSQWAIAIAAVCRDLQCRRHGRMISFIDIAWELTVDTDGRMLIGLTRLSDDADLSGFTRGRGYAVDATSGQATVWIAEAIQDELAGYEFVQWPIAGHRLLDPTLSDGQALWVDPSTNTVVAPIGSLCGGRQQAE